VSILTKTTDRVHFYNRQTKRLYTSRIYSRWKERFRLGTDTKQKGANDLMNIGGLTVGNLLHDMQRGNRTPNPQLVGLCVWWYSSNVM